MHPVTRFALDEIERQGRTYKSVYDGAGLNRNTFRYWRDGKTEPNLRGLEAALNELGYRLTVTDKVGDAVDTAPEAAKPKNEGTEGADDG